MASVLGTALEDRVIEPSGLGRGGEVVIYELPPLHHHHGELVRVVALVLVDHGADQPGVGQGTIADRSPHLLNTVTVVRRKEPEC